MKSMVIIFLFVIGSRSLAAVKCQGEDREPWIQAQRQLREKNDFFQFAISQFGPVVLCRGEVTAKSDGNQFGRMTFNLKKSAVLFYETMAPETMVARIEARSGFPNEAEAIRQLKETLLRGGLKIDFSQAPELKKTGDEETKTFWDPNPGTNGRAFLVYRSKKLKALGYGVAL